MSTVAVPGFVQEVRAYGRFDVEGCLNCDSCTVICALSNVHTSFPRKSIQQVLIGLKDSVVHSLEPWLCHDCGDCATSCPRQTEPRESMMTLRRYLVSRYDVTGIASTIQRSGAWEITAMAFVAALVFALVFVYHLFYVELPMGEFVSTPLGLEHMFPTITYFSYVVFLLPLTLMVVNGMRMHRRTMVGSGDAKIPLRFYLLELKTLTLHLFFHRNLSRCSAENHNRRWIKHWLLGTACTMMGVIAFFFLAWFQTDALYPIYDPQRWLGYIATVVMIYVPADIMISRIRKRKQEHKYSERGDLILPSMLLLVALSGIAVHIFRYAEWSMSCHYAYAVHLAITVALLLIELPFGKWSHVVYRPLALFFQSVKERAQEVAEVALEGAMAGERILGGTQPS